MTSTDMHVSYSPNSVKGSYIEDNITRDYYKGY